MNIIFRLLTVGIFLLFAIAIKAQPSIGGFYVYYGHLHNHSNVSDGTGTPDEAYSYAKNTGKLDFFSLADHSGAIDATEWQTIKAAADKYNQDSVFTAFYGFEWTENVLGHVTVINPPDYITTASPYNTFAGLCSWLNENECVAFFNHPGRNNSTGLEFAHFATTPTNKFVGMELWNKTDRFPVYYYTDGYYPNDGGKSWFDEALTRGWMIGAAGSEDNHSGTWGTATSSKLAVLSNANTRTDIYNALKARRFFTTYDKTLALSFKIGENEMGSVITAASNSFSILVSDAEGELVTKVELLKNGAVVQAWEPNTTEINISGTLVTQNGEYYYVRIKQEDNDEAISSPIWCGQVNQLPSVEITSPQQNSTFLIPATINFEVAVSDPDGTIQEVEYYQGQTKIGESTSSPFSFVWNNPTAGVYSITAKAFDNGGASSNSGAVQISIINPGDPVTVSSRISTGMDDVEESSTGNILANVNSSDIELVYDASTSAANQVVGLRFVDMNIPQNAVISNAYIQFTCDEKNKAACNITISGEDIDNALPFSTVDFNVSSRTKTSAKVNWIPAGWSVVGETGAKQQTPNLASVVQEIVNRPGYLSSGAISFIISGTGSRIAESYEGSASQAAVLSVTYTIASGENQPPVVSLTSPANNSVFTEPASITLTANASDADGNITKVDFLFDNVVVFTDNDEPFSYLWSSISQGSYRLKAVATDNLGATATSSEVTVTVNAAPPVIKNSISSKINTFSDDAEETSKGVVVLNGDDIELTYDTKTTGSQVVGLRFNNLTIPQGAAISMAYIQFTVDEITTASCNLTIKGENSANSSIFLNEPNNISGRTRTSAGVKWVPSGWTAVDLAGTDQQTPDLKSIVQEVVNISSWNSGGSMVFIITGTGNGKRTAVSFDTNALKAATLFVEYEEVVVAQSFLKSAKIASGNAPITPSKRELLLYPNPAKDVLNVEFVNDEDDFITEIEIYNVAGTKVAKHNLSGTKVSVGVGDIPCGIYLVRISTTSDTFLRKVVKN